MGAIDLTELARENRGSQPLGGYLARPAWQRIEAFFAEHLNAGNLK